MNNKSNLLLAIILSTVIIGAWSYFFPAPKPPATPAATPVTTTTADTTAGKKTAAQKDAVIKPRDQALADNPRVLIDSPTIKGSINLRGLRFDDIVLKQYTNAVDDQSPVTLLSPSNSANGYVVDLGWLSRNDRITLPNSDSLWTANKKVLKNGDNVTLTYSSDGLIYKLLVSLDDNYLFTIKQSVQNIGVTNQDIAFYGLTARFGAPPVTVGNVREGPMVMLDKKLTQETYAKMIKTPFQGSGKTGWFAFSDKYWLTALVPDISGTAQNSNKPATTADDATAIPANPDSKLASRITYDKGASLGRGRYQVDYTMDYDILPRRHTIEKTLYLFVGPKDTGIINDYATSKNIDKFNLTIDYGWLYILTKPMAWLLHFLSDQLHSVGLAILALTVVVRLLLFPFAQHSFKSMAMMRKLAPKVEELKKRHKTSAEQSQAMMALYKKEGVNPLAGCLPMLIQIPVFFALYHVFNISIEFRHAPFFGWISDLSVPDPYGLLTGFGLFPWQVPAVLHIVNIGIWPIIMGFTLWLQQKFNPPASDPLQQKIFSYFPYIFTFMLGSSPAGLVIYWAWNNALSILQQYVINRRLGIPTYTPFRTVKKTSKS
ncbi:MAG: membrane protein insertase YidC [Hydrotalea sp.]|nr:membrane protein insertase YidC [Hydrotalea sp.]